MVEEQKTYTDKEYFEGLKEQNNVVLNAVYANLYGPVESYIINNGGSINDAKDIFQEAVIVLYQKIRKNELTSKTKFRFYLYSTARNLWFKEIEALGKKEKIIGEFKNITDNEKTEIINDIIYSKRLTLFRTKFEELSDDCKRVIRLFLNGMSLTDITSLMGYSSIQHTKNRKYRCKESLLNKIRQDSTFKSLSYGKNSNDRKLP